MQRKGLTHASLKHSVRRPPPVRYGDPAPRRAVRFQATADVPGRGDNVPSPFVLRLGFVPFLGLDIVFLRTPEQMARAFESGDAVRFTDVSENLEGTPWLIRWFFPVSRFFDVDLGVKNAFFMPFRADGDETLKPSRDFLDGKFGTQGVDIQDIVEETADALMDRDLMNDKQRSHSVLSGLGIRAVWRYIVPKGKAEIPDEILEAATDQTPGILQSFWPPQRADARKALPKIYKYADEALRGLGVRDRVPDNCVVDTAHVFFAMENNGPPVLRALGENPQGDMIQKLSDSDIVPSVIRIPKCETTLGGLLEKPVKPGKTLILVQNGEARKLSPGLDHVFSTGPGQRRCAAEKVIVDYFQQVQRELLKRQQ